MSLDNISLKKLKKNEIYKLLIKYKLIKNKNLSYSTIKREIIRNLNHTLIEQQILYFWKKLKMNFIIKTKKQIKMTS